MQLVWVNCQTKKHSISLKILIIWMEPQNDIDDSYFCCLNAKGFNAKNKKKKYPSIRSVAKTVTKCKNISRSLLSSLQRR